MYLAVLVVIFVVIAAFVATRFILVKDPSKVIAIKRLGGKIVVARTGGFIWPLINSFLIVSLNPRMITVVSGEAGAITKGSQDDEHNTVIRIGDGSYCKDDIRVDIAVAFQLTIPTESVAEIVGQFDPKILSSAKSLAEFFEPKFAEALKSATRKHDYLSLMNDRSAFRESVREAIAKELHGFVLSDVLIAEVRQTSVDKLNPNDILDVQGLELITKTTTERNTNIKRIKELGETQFTEEAVKGQQARLQLDRGLKEEQFKTEREIETIRLEEETRIKNKEVEENLAREKARLQTAQETRILEENVEREVEIISINNKQMLGIKEQENIKNVKLAEVEANNEVAKKTIDNEVLIAEKNVELHGKEAQVVAIKKEIANEEERTSDIRAFSAAERSKKVKLTEAEAEAMAYQTKEVTLAETHKQKSVIEAEEKRINADAQLVVVEKDIEGRRKLVELTQDEIAAPGLAEAKADTARAEAKQRLGEAEANTIHVVGEAQANAKKALYVAMDQLPENVRQHELRLKEMDIEKELKGKGIDAERDVGVANAEAYGKGLEKATISVIGDANTLNTLNQSRSVGLSLDHKIRGSELLSKVAEPYINGEKDLPEDLANILKEFKANGSDVMNLTVAQALSNPKFGNIIGKLLSGSKQ